MYLELVRHLGEIASTGDKAHKQLLTAVLPRLAQFETLPASVVPQLIQLANVQDDRCVFPLSFPWSDTSPRNHTAANRC